MGEEKEEAHWETRFSTEQIREFNDAFAMLDKQGLGYFLVEELQAMLRTIGYNPTDSRLEELTIEVDDGNGQIVFEEFMDLISKLETDKKNSAEAKDAFNAFDFEGKGYVAANDIKEALLHVMEKASDEDREGVIKHFKLEKNRKVFFPEFRAMITPFKSQYV